jgi:hypothetical protein
MNVRLSGCEVKEEIVISLGSIGLQVELLEVMLVLSERKEVGAAIQDGSRDWITLLGCVYADGSHLPPSLIYQSAASAIRSSWVGGES